MDGAEFRRHGHALVEWIAQYLESSDRYPVLSRAIPGELTRALPDHAPEAPEPFDAVLGDLEHLIVPALTHWNHPGFFAYSKGLRERFQFVSGCVTPSATSGST